MRLSIAVGFALAGLVTTSGSILAAPQPLLQSKPAASRSIACTPGYDGIKHKNKAACYAGCRARKAPPGCEAWCDRNCD